MVRVVAEGDAAGAVEVVDGPVGVVLAQGEECGSFVGVVLAAVLGEKDGVDAMADGGEGAAGVDFRELAGVHR